MKLIKDVNKKRLVFSILVLILVLLITYKLLGPEIDNFIENIEDISMASVAFTCFLYFLYIIAQAYGYYLQLKISDRQIVLKDGYEINALSYFTQVVTFSTATIPLQTYYLHQRGVLIGKSLGTLMYNFAFHKGGIFIWSIVTVVALFFLDRSYLYEYRIFIIYALVITVLIVLAYILAASSKKFHRIIKAIVSRLPDNEKWSERKANILKNLQLLADEGDQLKNNRGVLIKIISVNIIKNIFCVLIPYFTFKNLGLEVDFIKCLLASSLMFLFSSSLPSIAGVGSAELSYMVVFTPLVGKTMATSSMILYRFATYIFPFILGFISFLKIQKRFIDQ